LWLIVPGGIEYEFAEYFSGGGGHDRNVEVLDQHGDVGSGVGSANTNVVELAAVTAGTDLPRLSIKAAGPAVT